ncbi:unnamed protein product [Symbiodinium sp. CCMP2456]|nr:unnamed protein product [Symbiodinium sp. CCMP2456]
MRRQEQEEWEHAMRRKFIEEAEQLKAARRAQREVEELQEKKWKEGAQRRQAMRQEGVREREEAKKRRQEQEEWEQAMRRKIAAEEQQNEEFRRFADVDLMLGELLQSMLAGFLRGDLALQYLVSLWLPMLATCCTAIASTSSTPFAVTAGRSTCEAQSYEHEQQKRSGPSFATSPAVWIYCQAELQAAKSAAMRQLPVVCGHLYMGVFVDVSVRLDGGARTRNVALQGIRFFAAIAEHALRIAPDVLAAGGHPQVTEERGPDVMKQLMGIFRDGHAPERGVRRICDIDRPSRRRAHEKWFNEDSRAILKRMIAIHVPDDILKGKVLEGVESDEVNIARLPSASSAALFQYGDCCACFQISANLHGEYPAETTLSEYYPGWTPRIKSLPYDGGDDASKDMSGGGGGDLPRKRTKGKTPCDLDSYHMDEDKWKAYRAGCKANKVP